MIVCAFDDISISVTVFYGNNNTHACNVRKRDEGRKEEKRKVNIKATEDHRKDSEWRKIPLADGAEFEMGKDWNTHSFINGWRFLEDGDGWMGIELGV